MSLDATNGALDRAVPVETLKTNQSTGTANGADLTVWTPASGKKIRLYGLRVRASIAGRYEVRDATTVIGYFYLAANVFTDVINMPRKGHLFSAADNALKVRNSSGSAADMDATAWGGEE